MFFRSALIAGLVCYLFYVSPDREISVLAFLLVGYEYAYYSLRKEKCEAEYSAALLRYSALAKELDGEA